MGRGRTARAGLTGLVVGALAAVAGVPGLPGLAVAPAHAASAGTSGEATRSDVAMRSVQVGASRRAAGSYDYGFAAGARSVEGAPGTADAPLLAPGGTYRGTLPRAAELYYRLDLDDSSNAYVSVTAVPRQGSTLTVSEGIRVAVRSAEGHSCSYENATFGAARSPHPITAWGARTTAPVNRACQGAGSYYVVVERVGTAGASSGAWDLELTAATEPALEATGATQAPEVWDSASPAPAVGEAEPRPGGSGFTRAAPVGQGVWSAGIAPGQTLFYRVPVGWGRQPHATAELGGSGADSGYTLGALDLTLYNPVRADVEDVGVGYDGRRAVAALPAVPPVDHANRYAGSDRISGMRFAGSYYLVVHLAARVADEFGDGPYRLTLRVSVKGAERAGPGYAGQPVPRDLFQAAADDRRSGGDGTGSSGGTAMRALAVGGIGAGTVVLVVLGAWTVLARRRTGTV